MSIHFSGVNLIVHIISIRNTFTSNIVINEQPKTLVFIRLYSYISPYIEFKINILPTTTSMAVNTGNGDRGCH